jgi:phosphatidylserine/phosphatidylglycerophosphate/cardiolipin synthase-like enzyme
MKLIVQPDAGGAPVLTAIRHAKKAIDVLIFRFEFAEMSEALTAAVRRGVAVRALIAHTNSGGERSLRKLEMNLLEGGVTVSRTSDDLKRYHGKMMVTDHQLLHLYGFNFTSLDMKRSRSFGIETRNKRFVDEACKLFEADVTRQPYVPGFDRFIVSPENARERLSAFIGGARKQLLIYDPKISDPSFLRLLAERAKAGLDVRIIGKVMGKKSTLMFEKYPGKRLHVRAIVRDGNRAFLGSQSLRRLELERRREIGLVADDPIVVRGIQHVFEADWALTPTARRIADEEQLLKKAELAERTESDEQKSTDTALPPG